MGKGNRATQEKRNRERAQKERQQEKEEQRVLRKEARADRTAKSEQGIDPDLVGIYPGPQPEHLE
jgi:aspartate carbamoyltransferase catalytic subunit